MTRTSPFHRDLLEPDVAIRAAFRRRLAKICMGQNTEQPRGDYDRTTSCPACGCLDVVIDGHEMSCKRCWTTTDLSAETERVGSE